MLHFTAEQLSGFEARTRSRWSATPVGDCVVAAPFAPKPDGSAP